MVEGARLESVYTLTAYRGFESLSLRQAKQKAPAWGLLLCQVDGFEPSKSEWWFDEPTESAKNAASGAMILNLHSVNCTRTDRRD